MSSSTKEGNGGLVAIIVGVVVLIILMVIGGFYLGYSLLEDPDDYSLADTRDVEYVGKYTISSIAYIDSIPVITENYLLVFKQFDEEGNSTAIEIDVSKDTYDSTDTVDEPLRMQFFQNDEGDIKIGWGNSLKTIKDYDPSTSTNGYTLEEAIFKDELYSPTLR